MRSTRSSWPSSSTQGSWYGPPGTGKTTLGRIIAARTAAFFVSLNAVLAGVKDIREAIAKARQRLDMNQRRTILFQKLWIAVAEVLGDGLQAKIQGRAEKRQGRTGGYGVGHNAPPCLLSDGGDGHR